MKLTQEKLKTLVQEEIKKFLVKEVSSGRECDNCGKALKEEDFDAPGSWSYTCPRCGFHYVHSSSKGTPQQQAHKFKMQNESILREGKFTAARLYSILDLYSRSGAFKSHDAFMTVNDKDYSFGEEYIEPPDTVWGDDEDGNSKEFKIRDIQYVTINGKMIK